MRPVVTWSEIIQDKEKLEPCAVYDLSFSPDGSQLIVAAGARVLVYEAIDGSLIQALKAHKDLVYCVSYSKDGKRFASGSKDKHVIIWTSKLEGILKYSHGDAIQCIAYNPTSSLLASCSVSDFGLWSPDQKSVQKYKASGGRITCCSWTADGVHLALGLYNGTVSIRNKAGEEKTKIERPGGSTSPVWSLCWSPITKDEPDNVLCVADWGRSLSFYDLDGKQVAKDRSLGFDPTCVNYFGGGEYIAVSGSNRQAALYSRDGIFLETISEQDSWVWCCKSQLESNCVALGCQDGTVVVCQLVFSTVHGLYKERYAFRENMTDVVVQHLLAEQKVRIKCRDLVKKIAIYKNRLAVQLPERIIVYELFNSDGKGMHYKVKEKILQKFDCNLLVVCSNNIVLCQEQKLQSLSLQGTKEREWVLESLIRYIKVIGGPASREGLLVGLKNGQVLKIFLDNPFPVQVIKVSSAVRCLDLSSYRSKLAVVDEQNTCLVFDVNSKQLLYQEPNANSVAWNSHFEDMLCFSGNGFLSIKAADFPVHQQKLQGFVVGFCGSKVFCLHAFSMTAVDVPQSAPLYQFLERKMFEDAFRVACLGVTESDWRVLATSALEALDLTVARKAFVRVRDLRFLELIESIEVRKKQGDDDNGEFLGDIYAHCGSFAEAAKLYKKCGRRDKALAMYTGLRMFDLAQDFVGAEASVDDRKSLIRKKAEWARDINDPRAAAEMYLAAGEYSKTIEIAGENAWIDMLVDIGQRLGKADNECLASCAMQLKRLGQHAHAADIYNKMGDFHQLAALYVDTERWEDAFILAEKHPELKEEVYLPYAKLLAENDRFVEAQKAFCKAGHADAAVRTLEILSRNAVSESRFDDAAHYHWVLATQFLDLAKTDNEAERDGFLLEFRRYKRCSELYYAYHAVQKFIDEPFTSYMPEAMFNIARYLYHETFSDAPPGISKVATLYALARQSRHLGGFKLARFVYEKLQHLHVPARFRDSIDLGNLTVRAKPFHDAEDLLPMCYRCSTTTPLLSNRGNRCVNCGQPFVHSFVSFEILPLVEFFLEDGISDEEALRLIDCEPAKSEKRDRWAEVNEKDYQSLRFEEGPKENGAAKDAFGSRPTRFEQGGCEFEPVTVNRQSLQQMERSDVVVCKWPPPLKYQYFRNVMPDVSVAHCFVCKKLFHSDDFELQRLQNDCCPFCRTPSETLNDDRGTVFQEFL